MEGLLILLVAVVALRGWIVWRNSPWWPPPVEKPRPHPSVFWDRLVFGPPMVILACLSLPAWLPILLLLVILFVGCCVAIGICSLGVSLVKVSLAFRR